MPGMSGAITAASPDGTTTVEIDGQHVGIGTFASTRILVTRLRALSRRRAAASRFRRRGQPG